jgi:hypothetical protein
VLVKRYGKPAAIPSLINFGETTGGQGRFKKENYK